MKNIQPQRLARPDDRPGAVSRRQLLAMAGALPAIPILSWTAWAEPTAAGKVSGIVIRNGWILRTEDISRLRLA